MIQSSLAWGSRRSSFVAYSEVLCICSHEKKARDRTVSHAFSIVNVAHVCACAFVGRQHSAYPSLSDMSAIPSSKHLISPRREPGFDSRPSWLAAAALMWEAPSFCEHLKGCPNEGLPFAHPG